MRTRLLRLILLLFTGLMLAGLAGAAPARSDPSEAEMQKAMTFTIVRSSAKGCEPDCPEWLVAQGSITRGTPVEFRKALDLMQGRKLPVVLLSLGGDVIGAVAIGYMVRRAGLTTTVGITSYKGCKPSDAACKLPPAQGGVYRGTVASYGSYCVSACPLILAAGARRIASPKSYIGVHQIRRFHINNKDPNAPYDARNYTVTRESPEFKAVMKNIVVGYLGEMGISPDLIDDMNRASGENLYRLSSKRARLLKLLTEKGSAETVTSGSICRSSPRPENCRLLEKVE